MRLMWHRSWAALNRQTQMWKSRREAGKAMPRDRRAWATRGVASSVHCAVGATARSVPQSGHKRLGARSQSGRDGRWLHQGWVHSTMGYPCRARSVARGLITCCWVWPPPHALSCVGQSRLLCGEGGGGRVGCEEKKHASVQQNYFDVRKRLGKAQERRDAVAKKTCEEIMTHSQDPSVKNAKLARRNQINRVRQGVKKPKKVRGEESSLPEAGTNWM